VNPSSSIRKQPSRTWCISSAIEVFGYRAEPRHIGKKHGKDLALALDGASRGEDFIGQVLGGVGLGLLV